jgi:hypothetical protein
MQGPITLFDSGTYAGDARMMLADFFSILLILSSEKPPNIF